MLVLVVDDDDDDDFGGSSSIILCEIPIYGGNEERDGEFMRRRTEERLRCC